MINLENATRCTSVGRLSRFLYPWHTLERNARNGDLFVCNLVREAKPRFDPDCYSSKLQKAFQYRSDYMAETGHAIDPVSA